MRDTSGEPTIFDVPAPTPVVDVHAHAMPLPILESLADDGLADLGGLDRGTVVLAPGVSGIAEGAPIPCPVGQYDVGSRLAAMDDSGVDVAAVSAPPFLSCTTSVDESLVLDVVRASNEAVRDFVAQAADRLVGLATLPVGSEHAREEAERCIADPGFAGFAIGTYGLGRELDDTVNEELWTYLAARRSFVLLHPSRVSGPERLADFHLPQLLGYPAETALAVTRLLFGGVLERHDLVLCVAHGGGCLPSVAGRLDLGWARKDVARTTSVRPSELLRRLYFDTAVFDPTALRRLVEDAGARNVLLGTDAPFDLAEERPLDLVAAAGLSAGDEALVRGGNAERLLGPHLRGPSPEAAQRTGAPVGGDR